MAYMRRDIRGTSGQDLEKINSNFMDIFDKVFGNINFSDADKRMKNKILTQWIPIQGEGNLDSSNPMYIRFFVPPNTNKVVSSNFNVLTEHYRMDSSITSSEESKEEVVSIVSNASPSTTETSSSVPSSDQTSTSSSGGVSSVGGGGATSTSGGGSVRYVRKWGPSYAEASAPTDFIYPRNTDMVTSSAGHGFITSNDSRLTLGAVAPDGKISGSSVNLNYVDLHSLQHSHEIPNHTHAVPSHSHSITLSPHSHSVLIPSHSHTVNIPSHTHDVTGSVTIPAHSHTLNEGVKVSTTSPTNIVCSINDNTFVTMQGSSTQNNLDITSFVKIGEWNTIKITASTVARAVLYGTLEVLIK